MTLNRFYITTQQQRNLLFFVSVAILIHFAPLYEYDDYMGHLSVKGIITNVLGGIPGPGIQDLDVIWW